MSTTTIDIYHHKHGDIPKLNGNNYQSWLAHLTTVLAAGGYGDIATGEEEPVLPPRSNKSIMDYNKRKSQAAAIIFFSITEPVLPHILGCKTDPAEMLKRLATQYDTARNIATAARLKETFSREAMREGDSIA